MNLLLLSICSFVGVGVAGYPTAAAEQGQAGGKKGGRASTKSRGEKGFIEGWYVLPTTSYSIHRHHLLNCRL
uniref:Secreted protein n=1 Tax=Triticum urartu TaxID=4572 RepID=A0A8R7U225_TRIUA